MDPETPDLALETLIDSDASAFLRATRPPTGAAGKVPAAAPTADRRGADVVPATDHRAPAIDEDDAPTLMIPPTPSAGTVRGVAPPLPPSAGTSRGVAPPPGTRPPPSPPPGLSGPHGPPPGLSGPHGPPPGQSGAMAAVTTTAALRARSTTSSMAAAVASLLADEDEATEAAAPQAGHAAPASGAGVERERSIAAIDLSVFDQDRYAEGDDESAVPAPLPLSAAEESFYTTPQRPAPVVRGEEDVEIDADGDAVLEIDDESLAEEPGPVDALLRRLAAEAADPQSRIAVYERELRHETSRARIALLEHEIGDLLERGGLDLARVTKDPGRGETAAIKAYARSLAADPMLRPNLWAVRRIFYRRKLWSSLLKLLDAEMRYASDDRERAELLVEKGHIHEDALQDPAEALRCYEAAHKLDPQALAPLAAMEHALPPGDPVALLAVQRSLATATAEPSRRVALLIDLARAEEVAALSRRVAEPGEAGSVAQRVRAAQVEEGITRALGYLHEAYEVGVDQLRVVDEIVRITAPMIEPPGPVLRPRPRAEGGESAEADAAAVGRATECIAALDVKVELMDLQAAQARSGGGAQRQAFLIDEVVAIRRYQASLAAGVLRKPELVWYYLQAANSRSPADPLLVHDLVLLAEDQGRYDDLDGLLQVLSERYEFRGGGSSRSTAGYGEGATSGISLPPLSLQLRRAEVLRSRGLERDAEALEREIIAQHADRESRSGSAVEGRESRSGSAVEGHESRSDSAVEGRLPLPLLVQEERRALRRQQLGTVAALAHREAALALAGVALRPDEAAAPDAQWAAGALLRAGSAALRAGEYEVAESHLREAREAALLLPGEGLVGAERARLLGLVLDRQEHLLEIQGRFAELAALYEEALRAGSLVPERVVRLREACLSLYAQRLGGDGAVEPLQRALVHAQALCALRPEPAAELRLWRWTVLLARRVGDARVELEGLLALARLSPPTVDRRDGEAVERRLEALLRRAELAALPEIGDEGGAVALYHEALRLRPGEPQALEQLEALLRRAGRHAELAVLLRAQADACAALGPDSAPQLLSLQLRLAEIYERELRHPEQAAAVYREVLIRQPGNVSVLRALARLYRDLGELPRLSDTLELLCGALPGGADRAVALLRLGEVYERGLERLADAEAVYDRALQEPVGLAPGAPRGVSSRWAIHAALGLWRVAARRGQDGAAATRMAQALHLLAEHIPGAEPQAVLERALLREEWAATLAASGGLRRGEIEVPGRLAEAQQELLALDALRASQSAAQGADSSISALPIEPPVVLDSEGMALAQALLALVRLRTSAQVGDSKALGAALADLALVSGEPAPVRAELALRAGVLGGLNEEGAVDRTETQRRLILAHELATAPAGGSEGRGRPEAGGLFAVLLADSLEGGAAGGEDALVPWDARTLSALAAALRERRRLAGGADDASWYLAEAELLLTGAAGLGDARTARALRQQAAEAAYLALLREADSVPALLLLRHLLLSELGAGAEGGAPEPATLHALAHYTLRLAALLRHPERRAALYAEAGELLVRLGESAGGAAALRCALDSTPRDVALFGRLYGLLAKRAQPEEAGGAGDLGPLLELLDFRLAVAEGVAANQETEGGERPLRVALLLQRAALLAASGQEDAAATDLRALLMLDEGHLTARRRLADLLGQRIAAAPEAPEAGALRAEALVHYERYLQQQTEPGERRAVHLEIANLRAAAEPARASEHLKEALELLPQIYGLAEGAALDPEVLLSESAVFRWQVRLLTEQRRPAEAVAVLKRLAALLPPGESHGIELARIELEIADILQDEAGDPRGALAALERALRADPLSLEGLDRLVLICQELGEGERRDMYLKRAAREARGQVMAQEPGQSSGEPYHALAQVLRWLGHEDAARLARQAEAVLSGSTPKAEDAAPAREPTRAVGVPLRSVAFADEARGVLLDLWREVADTANKLLGPELTALHGNPKERLNAREVPALWLSVDHLVQCMGDGATRINYGLYLSREQELCALSFNNLVCGSAFGTPFVQLPAPLRFRLVRVAVLLPDRLGPALTLSNDDLMLFLAALGQVAEVPGPPLPGVLSARLPEQARAIGRVLTRKERRGLQALAGRLTEFYGDPARGDVAVARERIGGWLQALRLGAARLALALTGDLAAALQELGQAFVEQRPRALTLTPLGRALLQFSVSAEIDDLRRELALGDVRGAAHRDEEKHRGQR